MAGFFLPGIGQLYNKQDKKALMVVVFFLALCYAGIAAGNLAVLVVSVMAFNLFSGYDAYRICQKRADLQPVSEWEWL
jgi:hypothetical protein